MNYLTHLECSHCQQRYDADQLIRVCTECAHRLLARYDLEKAAAKWPEAQDAQKDFDKFAEKYKEGVKGLTERYDELTGRGAEGGNTQAVFSKAFRAWEDLNNDLNPQIAGQERFATVLQEIRQGFDDVEKAVDEIEKDESLAAAEPEGAEKKKK